MPVMELANLPLDPPEFCAGTTSVGLELVDVYLWIFKRWMEQDGVLPSEFMPLIDSQMERGGFDQVSLEAIIERWTEFLGKLPEPTERQLHNGKMLMHEEETRRQEAMKGK